MSDIVAAGQLRAFIERIERIEAEIKDLNTDKSEVYKELRGVGFDVKAVRQCVAARKLDNAEREERNAIFDLYWDALTGASRVHVHEEEPNPSVPTPSQGVRTEKPEAATLTASGENSATDRASPGGDDGHRSEPSSPDAGAKNDGLQAVVDQQAMSRNEEQAVTFNDEDVPAFLRKPVTLRPHCLNPQMCAGSGREHCWQCRKAMAEEAA